MIINIGGGERGWGGGVVARWTSFTQNQKEIHLKAYLFLRIQVAYNQ